MMMYNVSTYISSNKLSYNTTQNIAPLSLRNNDLTLSNVASEVKI